MRTADKPSAVRIHSEQRIIRVRVLVEAVRGKFMA